MDPNDVWPEFHRRRMAEAKQFEDAWRARCAVLETALHELEASDIPNWAKAIARQALRGSRK